jgi:ADP-ribose pyrophosphatase YjhB (NUDIX family)
VWRLVDIEIGGIVSSDCSIPEHFVPCIPEGDDRQRLVCGDCGFINYQNPKIIVGAVCTWEDKYLLCKRAIAPRIGYWTHPAGYMELNETPAEGAAREVWEEAGARVQIRDLLAIFELPHISQVHMIYRAVMQSPDFQAGTESLDVILVPWGDVPWQDLAYPNVQWALQHHYAVRAQKQIYPISTPAHILRQLQDKAALNKDILNMPQQAQAT